MNARGIQTLYGRWLIDGAPRVLLFDTKSAYGYLDEWKSDLWSTTGIPSPPGDDETNEAIVFGYIVAWFLGEVRFEAARRLLRVPILTSILSMSRTKPSAQLWYNSTNG